MGVYSMDSITGYINFYEIITRRKEHDKPGTHWWSFMDIHPPKTYFYLMEKVQKDSNFLLQITTTKLLTNYFMISKNVNLNQIMAKNVT